MDRTRHQLKPLKGILLSYLHDLYDAERRLLDMLPDLTDATGNDRLKKHLRRNFQQGIRHILGLEAAFSRLDATPKASESVVTRALEYEATVRLERSRAEDGDVVIISELERIQDNVMALRNVAVDLCRLLQRPDVARLLNQAGDKERMHLMDLMEGEQIEHNLAR